MQTGETGVKGRQKKEILCTLFSVMDSTHYKRKPLENNYINLKTYTFTSTFHYIHFAVHKWFSKNENLTVLTNTRAAPPQLVHIFQSSSPPLLT